MSVQSRAREERVCEADGEWMCKSVLGASGECANPRRARAKAGVSALASVQIRAGGSKCERKCKGVGGTRANLCGVVVSGSTRVREGDTHAHWCRELAMRECANPQ